MAQGPGGVDIMSLPFSQLSSIKKQMEEEVQALTSSYSQLRMGLRRYQDTKESLDAITPANEGKKMLVPLTTSLYVAGELSNVDKVIIDVGTGYYVEKSVADATKYYAGKEAFLGDQLQELTKTINAKRENLQVLTEIMQAKMYEISAQSRAARQSSAAASAASSS